MNARITVSPLRVMWLVSSWKTPHELNATVKAAELIVKFLENEGVEYIFGVPGEENMDLLDALLGSSIRFVMTRHEQGAAFMADVYGRLAVASMGRLKLKSWFQTLGHGGKSGYGVLTLLLN